MLHFIVTIVSCPRELESEEEDTDIEDMYKDNHATKTSTGQTHNIKAGENDLEMRNDSGAITIDEKQNVDDIAMGNYDGNENEVVKWLRDVVRLPQYTSLFMDDGYEDLFTMMQIDSEQDLIDIGVNKGGHRKKILALINVLKQSNNQSNTYMTMNVTATPNEEEEGEIVFDVTRQRVASINLEDTLQ